MAICYEIADGAALARASREGARWLLATANLDPYPLVLQQQFLALARLRAIETGRWLVSAANTGPSGVVDAAGRLRGQLPPGRAGLGTFSLEPRTALTPYDRWGGPAAGGAAAGRRAAPGCPQEPKATWQAALSTWASPLLAGSLPLRVPLRQSALHCQLVVPSLTTKLTP